MSAATWWWGVWLLSPNLDKFWPYDTLRSMSTLNVSMPEAMRDYVEAQAEMGQYSASEYIRHLIREDQKRKSESENALLWELLAISAKELDDEKFSDVTVESLLTEGRARRAPSATPIKSA